MMATALKRNIVIITPLTQDCKEWINENLNIASSQWLGSSFCYDREFTDELLEAMIDDDLIENKDFQISKEA